MKNIIIGMMKLVSNYRLTNMQAAIGVAQLKVNKIIQLKKSLYRNYIFYLNKYGLKSLMIDFFNKRKSTNVHWADVNSS